LTPTAKFAAITIGMRFAAVKKSGLFDMADVLGFK